MQSAKKLFFALLAVATWFLLLIFAGMAFTVVTHPTAMGVIQLGVILAMMYPLLPLYRAIDGADSLKDFLLYFGAPKKILGVLFVFVLSIQPFVFPGKSLLAFPLFTVPSVVYPALIEIYGVFQIPVSLALTITVYWFQLIWVFLLVDTGYAIVTSVFKRQLV